MELHFLRSFSKDCDSLVKTTNTLAIRDTIDIYKAIILRDPSPGGIYFFIDTKDGTLTLPFKFI